MQGPIYRGQDAGPLLVTPEERRALKAAAPFVGVPYLKHGSTPAGWDCWGCARYLRQEVFNLETPLWSEAYTALDVRRPAEVERLILEHLAEWREVPVGPGAVLLFEIFGRRAHVGLMLTSREFVHTLAGQETAIVRLAGSIWQDRLRGAYELARYHHRSGALHPAG